VIKRTADALSSSNGPSEPGGRFPTPGHLFGDGPASLGCMGELTAESSRQLGQTDGGLAYAAVVFGHAGPLQSNGPHKSKAKGSDHSEPAASSEAATRRMSLGDMFGPLVLVATVSLPYASGKIRPQSTTQGSRTRVAFLYVYGSRVTTGSQLILKGEFDARLMSYRRLQSHSQRNAIP